MPEYKPDWELLRAKADRMKVEAGFALKGMKEEVRYRSVVSPDKDREIKEKADLFAGEVLTFLKDNLTAKLKPLHPTIEQVKIFQFLLDSAEDGELQETKAGGRLRSEDKAPFVYIRYEAGNRFQSSGELADQLADLFTRKDVYLTVRRGVDKSFPHGFAVFGSIGGKAPRSIDFITFPKKPITSEEARSILGVPAEQSGFTQSVNVYGNGERIILNQEGVYRGENVAMTDQYYFVGAFDGLDTGQTYWVYGSNGEIHDKISVTPRVGARQTAKQGVRNG